MLSLCVDVCGHTTVARMMHHKHATNGCAQVSLCWGRAIRIFACFYVKPADTRSTSLCKRCNKSDGAHIKDNMVEESALSVTLLNAFKSYMSVCGYIPSSIGVGDSCLDIVNIMAKLTA